MFRGWGLLPAETSQGADSAPFLGYVEMLDDNIVVAGRSQRFVTTEGGVILNALILAGLVICASALVIGYVLSYGVSSKLEIIDRTLDQVSRGNSEVRLPVGRSNDQIDHVSRQINAHLDRLGEFMTGMRNTIVAIAHDLKSPLNRAYLLLQDAARASEPDRKLPLPSSRRRRARWRRWAACSIRSCASRASRRPTTARATPLSHRRFSRAGPGADLRAGDRSGRADFALRPHPDDGAPIFGDRKMVQQMLVNLIENASRHAGPGAAIELAVREEHGSAIITVADNGPGIPPDKREEVFQPFRRLNLARGTPGAGLGLALVKAVAIRHHARVTLSDNKPGLQVTLSFPPMLAPLPWPERKISAAAAVPAIAAAAPAEAPQP